MLEVASHLPSPSPWFGPIAGVVAVVGFFRLTFKEFRTARRADPELVAAWTGSESIADCPFALRQLSEEGYLWHHPHTIVVHNGGKQPIFGVTLGIPGDWEGLDGVRSSWMNASLGLVPPGEDRVMDIGCSGRHDANQVPLAVGFTDVRGLEWSRDHRGRLRRRHGRRTRAAKWAVARGWRRTRNWISARRAGRALEAAEE